MFADIVKISVRAGSGGNGAVSFHREKYVASGGPDGGDGGKGGDIIFKADDNLSTLIDFRYKRKYIAEDGKKGDQKKSTGKSAPDTVIKVPRGTLIKDSETGRLIADISGSEPVIVARGGKGGKGNMNFATPRRQAPRFAKPGFPGVKFGLTLELKLLADVGLVGFPNVGKSSLISAVSAAKPEIANYHFTTLTPVLGVIKVDEKSFVMADIPGLIEGASGGAGLGHNFLRHVERCRLIIHVVDVSGIEGRCPKEDFEKINYELSQFSQELAALPQIVAANKSDIATDEQIEDFKNYINNCQLSNVNCQLFVISAATKKGTADLVNHAAAQLDDLPPVKLYEAEPVSLEELERRSSGKRVFAVNKLEDDLYEVKAEWLAPILAMVNMDDYESLQYFQRVLRSSGIIDALEAAGIQEGDTVSVFDFEFEFIN
ncbi:MAG: GTPase ObgE [Oscillospiraceae bacterium]|nr:GTPase ObgE [Oscillospiraceae bacterium]